MAGFIWTPKNVEHIAEHGITPEEAAHVVLNGTAIRMADAKWLARGQTEAGRYIQAIYVLESDVGELDWAEADMTWLDLEDDADAIMVIHARPLTARERSAFKAKRKGK